MVTAFLWIIAEATLHLIDMLFIELDFLPNPLLSAWSWFANQIIEKRIRKKYLKIKDKVFEILASIF